MTVYLFYFILSTFLLFSDSAHDHGEEGHDHDTFSSHGHEH